MRCPPHCVSSFCQRQEDCNLLIPNSVRTSQIHTPYLCISSSQRCGVLKQTSAFAASRGAGPHLEGDGDTLQEDGLSGAALPAAGMLLEFAAADALCLDDTARAALLAFTGDLPFLSERACMRSLNVRRRSGHHLTEQLHCRSASCGAQAAAQHCRLPSWRELSHGSSSIRPNRQQISSEPTLYARRYT